MNQLIEKIEELTPQNTTEAIDSIKSMITAEDAPIALKEEDLLRALSIEGEYLVLKLSYEDFVDELQYEKIKYKISQSLSIVVSYEDDGNSFENIEQFVHYISEYTETQQNAIFGIKKVEKLSEFPVTILFSGILPINQLTMHISKDIYDMIHADKPFFKAHFKAFREILSNTVGVPILPLFPKLDLSLQPTEAMLVDLIDERVVAKFSTQKRMDKITIDNYLQKLFVIYTQLCKKS